MKTRMVLGQTGRVASGKAALAIRIMVACILCAATAHVYPVAGGGTECTARASETETQPLNSPTFLPCTQCMAFSDAQRTIGAIVFCAKPSNYACVNSGRILPAVWRMCRSCPSVWSPDLKAYLCDWTQASGWSNSEIIYNAVEKATDMNGCGS